LLGQATSGTHALGIVATTSSSLGSELYFVILSK
jgi:hypothetical protein